MRSVNVLLLLMLSFHEMKSACKYIFIIGFQPHPQGLSLKKWVGCHPFFKGKALGTRLWLSLLHKKQGWHCWLECGPSVCEVSSSIRGDTISLFQLLFFLCSFV